MLSRTCIECQLPLQGRADKRFCDDGCRNSYNNRLNNLQHHETRTINAILRKNRKILEHELGQRKSKRLTINTLAEAGFNMKYHTHLVHTKKGLLYTFVYDYGYLKLENNTILLIQQKNNF